MAKELAHFKNFAKLKDTSVEFNDITVLAGKPGTGKSYVMKFMYAISETKYKWNHNILVDEYIDSYKETLSLVADVFIKRENENFYTELESVLEKNQFIEFKNKVEKYFEGESVLEDILKYINKSINNIEDVSTLSLEEKVNIFISNILESIFSKHSQVSEQYEVIYNHLNISYKDDKLQVKGSDLFDKVNEVVFVETPLILEFKKFMNHEKGKTPYHIESLLKILNTDYSFIYEEQEKFIKSFREKSKQIIQGDIESSGDSFIFNRIDDKNYDILNASSGIKSIGLLQYLVTNKALKKGSVLFWEEPEVHLHPEWQLRMVELFVELMNAGVKIVFSTHSPYMADYLNAISKKENYRDRISFNVLDEKDGVVTNHILNDDNWNILQSELMDTFEDILWEYL